LNLHELPGYNGMVRKVATVNLHHKAVQEETFKIYSYWVDPDQDGHFEDGVDGFRLDHMMDDLDHKKRLTDLFTTFWKPLFSRLKKINPALVNVAEQSDGGLGFEYWQSGVDRVFAFPLQRAFLTMNKAKISAIVDTIVHTSSLQDQVVFLENHDLQRFSSAVGNRLPLLKIGAALNLLVGGVPSIYYGQELGMTGTNAMGKYGWNDGNDIPLREAFEWYRQDTGKGMALWYKDTGPWWDHSGLKPNDGISLEEERKDASSIWSFYRKLIKIRKSYPALALGRYKTLSNNNDHVYSFIRYYGADQVIVLINFSGATQKVPIGMHLSSHAKQIKKIPCLLKDGKATFDSDILAVELPAWGIQIIPIEMTVDRGQKAR
jgi:glycosidase